MRAPWPGSRPTSWGASPRTTSSCSSNRRVAALSFWSRRSSAFAMRTGSASSMAALRSSMAGCPIACAPGCASGFGRLSRPANDVVTVAASLGRTFSFGLAETLDWPPSRCSIRSASSSRRTCSSSEGTPGVLARHHA